MKDMISFCGINCLECGAYQATINNDEQKRKEVAALWSKQYNANIKPEDIYCEGCSSGSDILFNHCNVCEIRKCGIEKGVINCAHCDEYVCKKLENFFKIVPDCKIVLDGITQNL